jgi:predicted metalloprotease with PDZ domain
MSRRVAALAGLVPALLLPVRAAPAQAISDIQYEVTFMPADAASRTAHVAMTFAVAGTAPVLLSLPAWTPGAYEIGNFAHWVSGFAATGDGKALAWDKADHDTWRIRPAGTKSVRVTFDYAADSLDNAMTWAKPDFLLFNGTNLFLYPEGQPLAFRATVAVKTDASWRVATSMPAVTGQAHTFAASNYHDLVDMPFFVGKFDIDSARIANHWVRLATYPAATVAGPARQTAWDQLKRVIPPEAAVFGEVPWDGYTVMQIADSTYGGASGLEHQSSHVDIVAPGFVGSDFQPSLYAHEIFHSWNVKRLRPADLWPYEYSRPQPTPWLWVSEGITDYYADLAEVRGGVVDARGFYALTGGKMAEVRDAPPVALEDASVSTWVHPADGTAYIYYPKGSLAGFMLDVLIRDASDNKRSLDDVMRDLYQKTYKQGRGFTGTDWWNAVTAAAGGKSFTQFNARYIDGREAFPWDSILPLAGLRATEERVPRLGVFTQPDANGILVANVQPGGAAAEAGVKPGDYLLAIGEVPVEDSDYPAKMRAKYATAAEGSPLPIKLRRAGQTLTLTAKLRFAPGNVLLDADPRAPAKAVRIRDGILKGVVDR